MTRDDIFTIGFILLMIAAILSCSNVPVQQPDICYGLQGEAYEDCILRHRQPIEQARPYRR
jgi:hypothetical protein